MGPELAITGMVAVGLVLALQAPVNGALGRLTGPLWAVLISFLVGFAVLLVISGATGGIWRLGSLGAVSPVFLAGGLIGAVYVTVAAWSVTRIGAGAVAAATVAGQMSSALVVDHLEVLGVEGEAIGLVRVIGALLLVAGTVLVARRAGTPLTSGEGERVLLMTGAVFVAGLLVGVQHPVNSTLAETTGGVQAALLNFAVGAAVLGLLIAIVKPPGSIRAARSASPWLFAGGPIGVVVVLASLGAVPVIGAAAIAAATVTGQLAGSSLLDRAGLLGLEVRPVDRTRAIGLSLLIAGTLLVL